jgi:hypothetical protein
MSSSETNLIHVAFGNKGGVAHEIAHPASKNFPEGLDPLESLLDELALEDDNENSLEKNANFIYAHEAMPKMNIETNYSLDEMMMALTRNLDRLSEDAARLKFYLDEWDITK